jgi:FixJ family two-component response regulator
MSELSLVFVVDDDPSMRALMEATLKREGIAVQLFESAEAMLTAGVLGDLGAPRCVLLDLEMPGASGLELLARMQQEWTAREIVPWPVIVITAKGSVKSAVQSMKMGAVDFLEKPFEIDALVKQVHDTLGRHNTAVAQAHDRAMFRQRVARLSPRERELLDAIVQGQSTKMIADKLGISARTVDHHRANLMQKMKAENVADLVRIAVGADYQSVPS